MSKVSINPVMVFMNQNSQTKAVNRDRGTDSFDNTLNNLKNDEVKDETVNTGKKQENVDIEQSDSKVKKFNSSMKKDSIKDQPVKDEELTDEEKISAYAVMVNLLKEVIQDKFGITDEELSQTMEELGISDENFLEVSNLTKIVMNLEGIENPVEMLTNQNFTADMKEILSKLEEIKTDMGTYLENTKVETTEIPLTEETTENDVTENVSVDKETEKISDDKETIEITDTSGEMEEADNENQMVSNRSESEKESLLKQDDHKEKNNETNKTEITHNVQPQDFASRLTEDLSMRVGEKQATQIVRQVVEQIQMQTRQGVTSMEMQLYPEHLGKVYVQIVSRDGSITAQITAESEAAKNALETQLTLLKENLNNQGVKIENVEVTIASHAFEQNMQGEGNGGQNTGRGNKGKRASILIDEGFSQELSDEEEKVMEVRGNTVSYSA